MSYLSAICIKTNSRKVKSAYNFRMTAPICIILFHCLLFSGQGLCINLYENMFLICLSESGKWRGYIKYFGRVETA